jgi:hypothetical protein
MKDLILTIMGTICISYTIFLINSYDEKTITFYSSDIIPLLNHCNITVI